MRYENFFDVYLDLLCICDGKGNIIDINDKWLEILDYSRDELKNMSFMDIVHPEDANTSIEEVNSFDDLIKKENFVNRIQCKNGRYRYFEWKTHLHNELFYCAAKDITERTELTKKLQDKNALLESILDNAPVGIWISYPEGNIKFKNNFVKDNFNLTEEEMNQCMTSDQEVLSKSTPIHFEQVMTFLDDKKHILETVKTKILNYDDGETGILNIGIDITKRKSSEEELKISEEKYRLLAENASDVIFVINLKTLEITYISPTILQLRGYSAGETMKQSLSQMFTKESFEIIRRAVTKEIRKFEINPETSKNIILEAQLICKKSKLIWVEISAKLNYNQQYEIEIIGSCRNIEKRKKFENDALYLSYHDQLTGLYNRRYYQEELKRIDEKKNYPITMVMADVNGLKLANDAFGHLIGDRILISIADIFKKECRSGDVIARIGGDEFILLLPKTNAQQAVKIVDRIQNVLSNTIINKVSLSVAFGWRTKYSSSEDFDEVFKLAEDAMYRHKLLEGKSYKSDTIKLISKSLYEKSPTEQEHSENVGKLCTDIGHALGLHSEDISELTLIGILHDIGKIDIDENILNKPGKLTKEEFDTMKRHSEIGYQILSSVNEFAEIAEYILAQHERLDGKGYPKGLLAGDIPIKSKILMVADAYDDMTRDHSYRKALQVNEAVKELQKNSGTQFDEYIVQVFVNKVLHELYKVF